MFGREFYGDRYFAPRYFGPGGSEAPASIVIGSFEISVTAGTANVSAQCGRADLTVEEP